MPFDSETAPLFSVGQVADLLGVQQAFLRRLDEQSVVRPARSEGGQRRYSRQEISALMHVMQLTSEGITLAGVRRVLELERELAEVRAQLAQAQAQAQAQGGSAAQGSTSGC